MATHRVLLLVLAVLTLGCFGVQAASVTVDASCTGTPNVGPFFSFMAATPDINGNSCQDFNPVGDLPWMTLDVSTMYLPAVQDSDITCSSIFFNTCHVLTIDGTTHIVFFNQVLTNPTAAFASGITGEFAIALNGAAAGQTFTVSANGDVPEPGSASLAALGLTAAAIFWRRRRSAA